MKMTPAPTKHPMNGLFGGLNTSLSKITDAMASVAERAGQVATKEMSNSTAESKMSKEWQGYFDRLTDHVNAISPSVSADNGDKGVTFTPGKSERTQVFGTPLTAPRAITLTTAGAKNGMRYRVVRKATATGASGLDVGGLKTLAVGQWCDVEFTGTAFILTAFGSL